MKSFFPIILILLSLISGCKSSSTSTEAPENQNFAFIEMNRPPCMYPCPSYQVRVYEDGSAEFVGKENVEFIGSYKGEVEPDFNRILWKSVRDADLKSKKSKYGMGNEDTPEIVIKYSGEDFKKEITYQSFEPIEINEIERHLKIIAENTQWIKPNKKP